jgi:hypothetical protein
MSNFGTTDYYLEISKGNIPGTTKINKFGLNENVIADTEEDVWTGGGTYPWPATALMTHTSQTVDQVAMRGEEIEWSGLDANWDEIDVLVTLDATNTTTPVALSTPMLRCHRGDANSNVVGDSPIRLHNAAETVDYAIIDTGNNQTTMALYTVPRGKTAYLTQYYVSVVDAVLKSPKSTRFKLWSADRLKNYEFQLKGVIGVPQGGDAVIIPAYPPAGGNSASEMTDIKMTAFCTSEPGEVAAGFDLILVDN